MRHLIACLLMIVTPLAAADHPRIGLVLSGGGARGLAHIGVLKALEAQHIHVDAIAGTSIGAVIGALYASGKSPEEIEKIALDLDWGEALGDLPPREHLSFRRKLDSRLNMVKTRVTEDNGVLRLPKGVAQGQNLQLMLQHQFRFVSNVSDFDQLEIPFRAVASNLVTGDPVVFKSGSLATAVRASMSIPGVFAPVEMDGKVLVDGGVANNLPVDVVKAMGVDYVIAVDITTPLYNAHQLSSVIPIIEQLTTLLTYNQQKKEYALLGKDDVLIKPDLSGVNTLDFDEAKLAIERGYDAVMADAPALAQFSSDRPFKHVEPTMNSPVITAIEIDNHSRISDDLITSQISQKVGEPLDEAQLDADIDSIYGYQYFESVQYEVVPGAGGDVLRIVITGNKPGTGSLGVLFELSTDARGGSAYNLGASFLKSGLTHRGGEWRTTVQFGEDPAIDTSLYLPLDFRQRWFVRPYTSYGERDHNRVVANRIDSRFRIDDLVVGVFGGLQVSNRAALGLGAERHDGLENTWIGAPAYSRFHDNIDYAQAELDTLDDLYFPKSGAWARIRYSRVNPGETGVDRYNLFRLEAETALPLGHDSLVLRGKYIRSDANVARYLQPSLGGIMNLSGLPQDALVDNNLVYASMTWLHPLTKRRVLPTDFPVYLGISVEAGNVWTRHQDIRLGDLVVAGLVMLGVDTPLGPVYLGYGRTEQDDSGLYLKLGHVF